MYSSLTIVKFRVTYSKQYLNMCNAAVLAPPFHHVHKCPFLQAARHLQIRVMLCLNTQCGCIKALFKGTAEISDRFEKSRL